jgi:hypothetical protein
MSTFKEKLGVEFLKGRDQAARPESKYQKDFLGEAVMLYGGRILACLAGSADGRGRVYDIVKQEDISISDVLQVIDFLQSEEMAEIVEEDKLGNHLVSILPGGRDYLSKVQT